MAGTGASGKTRGDLALAAASVASWQRTGALSAQPLTCLLKSGRVSGHPRGFHARGARAEVQAPDGTRFDVDGELVAAGAARCRAVRGAFRLVIG